MDTILYFACLTLSLVAGAMNILKNMHMFQLNSYKASAQFSWMKKNAVRLMPNLLILPAALITLSQSVAAYAVYAALFAALIIANLPKKAKKPLVFTRRVNMMLATCAILLLALGGLTVYIGLEMPALYGYLMCGAIYFVSPLIVILSNVINMPLEASIRRWYINDAKRMLRECPDMKIIGVTGSYGKTSMKFFLGELLSESYNVLITPESYNTPMGVVRTIREKLRATHEIFICEMGAKHVGDIKELCDIVKPTYGIITSVGPQHLETFKTIDNIVKTKFELSKALPPDGMLFLNLDCKLIADNIPRGNVITYGSAEVCNFRIEDVAVSENGTEFTITNITDGSCERYATQLVGEHNVINLAGAVAAARFFGVPCERIRTRMKKLKPVPHRLELVRTKEAAILDDAYNSNPNGSAAALRTLALFEGMKILVTPGMIELGSRQDEYNKEFGAKAAKVCDYVVLVGAKQTVPIMDGLMSGAFDKDKIYITEDVLDGIAHAKALPTDKKRIILIENDLPDNY